MYVLAIETTGAFASAALMRDGEIIGHIKGNDRFSHLQNLMPQVEAVVKENKLSLGDIDVIAVSAGPGSFTGIRIGVSSARALSQVLGIPCVAVSSLEALALQGGEYAQGEAGKAQSDEHVHGTADKVQSDGCEQRLAEKMQSNEYVQRLAGKMQSDECEQRLAGKAAGGAEECPLLICSMLDARRSQVYAGGYVMKDGFPAEEIKAGPYMLEEFMEKAAGYPRILLLGDAVDSYGKKLVGIRSEGIETAPESIRYQDAAYVARLGAVIFENGGGLDYNSVKPDYMRLAEAERKLREKQQKG